MIWLRDRIGEEEMFLFYPRKDYYRYINRRDHVNKLGIRVSRVFNPEVKVILAPKELSYWDDPKENS